MQYSDSVLEVQSGIFPKGKNVLLYDDTIVTGNTAEHAAYLLEKIGMNVVGYSFIMHLSGACNIKEKLNKPFVVLYEESL